MIHLAAFILAIVRAIPALESMFREVVKQRDAEREREAQRRQAAKDAAVDQAIDGVNHKDTETPR